MTNKTITRIVFGFFPLAWFGCTYGIILDHKNMFPDLPTDYVMPSMLGFLLSGLLIGVTRAFIYIVIEGGEI